MVDHFELKKLAEAAPEGPWFGPEYASGTSYVFDVDLGTLLHYESIESEQDACLRYVAAANPAAVLALIAENDGLKTGYEAYEQVNAGLKAEVEALRAGRQQSSRLIENLQAELDEAKQFQPIGEACLSNRDTLRASLGLKLGDNLHERVELLRKDAERYRFVIDCPIRTMVALGRKAHEEDFDLSMECDRLMGKGEQS